jgi:hypothetical protein
MMFYPSKTQDRMWRYPLPVETITGRAMVNPNYPVTLARPTQAICDSGAFQDIDRCSRLFPYSALDRQLRFQEQIRWRHGDHDWHFEAIVIYDQMLGVDEAVINGQKVKQRGTLESARPAIANTLASAEHYARSRDRIEGAICFVGQGITPEQYTGECVIPQLDLMRPDDWFAFGGFCIIGRQPSLKPLFVQTVDRVFPLLKQKGIRRAHLLGICVADMVEYAAAAGHRYGIVLSNDSSAPEFAAVVNGSVYVNGRLKKGPYTKADKHINYNPCELALTNIRNYAGWAASLGTTPEYLDEDEEAQRLHILRCGACDRCAQFCGGTCYA